MKSFRLSRDILAKCPECGGASSARLRPLVLRVLVTTIALVAFLAGGSIALFRKIGWDFLDLVLSAMIPSVMPLIVHAGVHGMMRVCVRCNIEVRNFMEGAHACNGCVKWPVYALPFMVWTVVLVWTLLIDQFS